METKAPWRRTIGERVERAEGNVTMKIVTLECGHEQIGGPPYNERRCTECADEAKYGKADPKARK